MTASRMPPSPYWVLCTLNNIAVCMQRLGVLEQCAAYLDACTFNFKKLGAKNLLAEVRRRAPGYLVPRLVREEAGAASKVPLA